MNRRRDSRFVIMLSRSERAAIKRAADGEHLPISTYARSKLLRVVASATYPDPVVGMPTTEPATTTNGRQFATNASRGAVDSEAQRAAAAR